MLILASASKARKRLIQKLSIDFEVMVSHIDEDKFEDSDIKGLVQKLSIAKAESIASEILLNSSEKLMNLKNLAILGCDSLFEFNGMIFGKPKNHEEAIGRLKMMSQKSGVIHTGHCLKYRDKSLENFESKAFNGIIKKVISTKINFSKLTDIEIANYVQTEEPMSCAGGFALDGKGSVFIESISGCYTNVFGLSLPWLRSSLGKALIPL